MMLQNATQKTLLIGLAIIEFLVGNLKGRSMLRELSEISAFFSSGFFFLIWYRQCQRGRLALSEVIASEKGKSAGQSPVDNLYDLCRSVEIYR